MINDKRKNTVDSKVIKVNFKKESLSIDEDSYLNSVTQIHCRACGKQKSREGSIELTDTWGYVCKYCQEKNSTSRNAETEATG